MAVKEHKLGQGTIAYAGEGYDYWSAKTARLGRGRVRITAGLLVVAALMALWLVSPAGPDRATARVVDVVSSSSDQAVRLVDVQTADGTFATFRATEGVPAINAVIPVTVMHDGRVVQGTSFVLSMWAMAGILGACGLLRAVRQYRGRRTHIRYR